MRSGEAPDLDRAENARGSLDRSDGTRTGRPRASESVAVERLRATTRALGMLGAVAMAAAPLAAAADLPDPHAVLPERPTLATHAHTVAPGWVEIEAGVERDRAAGGTRTESAATTTKLGLSRRAQLAITLNALRDPAAPSSGSGLGDLSLALKWRLVDGAPVLGDFAIQPALKLPTPGSGRRGTGTGTTDGSLLVISSQEFGPVSVDLNLGGTLRSGDGSASPVRASLWTAAVGLPVRGTLGWAAELYGMPGTHGPAGAAPVIAVLFGPTWTPRPWLELDAGAIAPVAGTQPHALYAGGVWNVGSAWRHATAPPTASPPSPRSP